MTIDDNNNIYKPGDEKIQNDFGGLPVAHKLRHHSLGRDDRTIDRGWMLLLLLVMAQPRLFNAHYFSYLLFSIPASFLICFSPSQVSAIVLVICFSPSLASVVVLVKLFCRVQHVFHLWMLTLHVLPQRM